MTKILDGKKLSAELSLKLKKSLSNRRTKPKLVIIQIGSLERSNAYIRRKIAFGESLGVLIVHKKYSLNVPTKKVIADISRYNLDKSVHGIMVQLPVPKVADTGRIVEAIDPRKDVDGLTALNTKLLFDDTEGFIPATAKGIMTLLKHYGVELAGKKVVLIGESRLVGRPIALALLNRKATVTICHTYTKHLAQETRAADILIVAAGAPGLITPKHVSKNQIVIDVGITVLPNKKVVGDVDFNKVRNRVKAISPVPGGVGPMTVLSLFENLAKAYLLSSSRR